MSEEIKFVGKEGKHFEAIEQLRIFYVSGKVEVLELVNALTETVNDWHLMMGRNSKLPSLCQPYIERIRRGDIEAARELYFYLSPIFFYVQALFETSRKDWRNAVTRCGIFCERIIKNVFEEIDRHHSTQLLQYLESKPSFEDRIKNLRSELEKYGASQENELSSSLRKIYAIRDKTGPYDVAPPELVKARMSINGCLAAFVEYLDTLLFLGTKLQDHYNDFVSFFNDTTRFESQIIFGEASNEIISAKDFIKGILYKRGYFSEERLFSDIVKEIQSSGYSFVNSTIFNSLGNLSEGKKSILTKKRKGGKYVFLQREPPSEYFKSQF